MFVHYNQLNISNLTAKFLITLFLIARVLFLFNNMYVHYYNKEDGD